MTLRIICRSKDGRHGYAEEVTNVKSIKPHYLSLLTDPVEYTDRNGHIWHCEKKDILFTLGGVAVAPAICSGVYRVEFMKG